MSPFSQHPESPAGVPEWVDIALGKSGIPSTIVDQAGSIVWANHAFATVLGLRTDTDTHDLLGLVADGRAVRDAIADVLVGTAAVQLSGHLVTTARRSHLTADLVVTRLGNGDLALVQMVDRSAEAMSASTTRALSENSLDVVVLTDADGNVVWTSPSITAVLGHPAEDVAGRPLADLLPADDLPRLHQVLREGSVAVSSTAPPHPAVIRLRSAHGPFRWMSVLARSHSSGAGEALVALGMRDVTDEVRAKRELARSEEQFRMAMLGAPEGMAVADAQDRVIQVNAALCDLLGRTESQLIGHRFREFIPSEQRDEVDQWRMRLVHGPASIERLQHPMFTPREEVWVDHSIGIMRDDAGTPTLFVHQFADRTAARRMQDDLAYRASHDSQTGLANRESLLGRLRQRLGAPPQSSEVVGVLFADIDNLKPINDQLGHPVGDAVIAAVADRLRHSVRAHDVVARIGGDEFAILLENCPTLAELEVVARNVQEAASVTVDTSAGPVDVTITVGAVLANSSAGTDATLARVDEALYEAKRGGRNRIAVSRSVVRG